MHVVLSMTQHLLPRFLKSSPSSQASQWNADVLIVGIKPYSWMKNNLKVMTVFSGV